MPPLPEAEWTWRARVAFAVFVVPLLVITSPLTLVLDLGWRRRKARLLSDRLGETICTFARSFDRRAVDPWVIRATWDELQTYLGKPDRPFPIRASDDWADDLWIDPEDLGDAFDRIARRSGHSTDGTERNPWYGRVTTVGDLVHSVNAQPRTEAA